MVCSRHSLAYSTCLQNSLQTSLCSSRNIPWWEHLVVLSLSSSLAIVSILSSKLNWYCRTNWHVTCYKTCTATVARSIQILLLSNLRQVLRTIIAWLLYLSPLHSLQIGIGTELYQSSALPSYPNCLSNIRRTSFELLSHTTKRNKPQNEHNHMQ